MYSLVASGVRGWASWAAPGCSRRAAVGARAIGSSARASQHACRSEPTNFGDVGMAGQSYERCAWPQAVGARAGCWDRTGLNELAVRTANGRSSKSGPETKLRIGTDAILANDRKQNCTILVRNVSAEALFKKVL